MSAGDLTGTLIGGRYRIVDKLGGGGMGDVYTVEHVGMGRRFALKLLNESYGEHPDAVERFRREAQAASRIEHENIVGVIDFGREPDGPYYLVMELLRGESLSVTLRQHGALPWRTARKIALQLCDALQAVHDVGIVHRDLKPANCFRTRVGDDTFFVKILDFGIAKLRGDARDGAPDSLTGTGTLLGTPLYMAPEQADDSAHVDHRADVYSLGVILYQMLTGQLPIRGQSDVQMLYNLLHRPPPPLHVAAPGIELPAGLEDVVLRALAKRPEERFADMRAFAAELRAIDGTSAADPGAVREPSKKPDELALAPTMASPISGERPILNPPTVPSGDPRTLGTTTKLLIVGPVVSLAAIVGIVMWPRDRPVKDEQVVGRETRADREPLELVEEPMVVGPSTTNGSENVAPEPEPVAPPPQQEPTPVAAPTEPAPTEPSGPPDEPAAPEKKKETTKKSRADKPAEAKSESPPVESKSERRAKQAHARAVGMIEESIRRHAARATSDRLRVKVVFAAVTGKPKDIVLGANVANTTFGKLVRADLDKLQISVYNEADVVVDQVFTIPQD